jgi:hypothetical protein
MGNTLSQFGGEEGEEINAQSMTQKTQSAGIEPEPSTSPSPGYLLTGRSPHLLFSLGAGVTPAQGSVKPTVGFTFNRVNSILWMARA